MALLHVNFFSNVLGKCMNMEVILPQRSAHQIGIENKLQKRKYPTLYLLHGMTDDETCWIRYTSIERYASDLGIAVVMPNGDLSWYSNTAYGAKYWTYLSEELPAICREFFPNMSNQPEDTFVAGNSMGGYGAFKLALGKPNVFGAAAGLSSALHIESIVNQSLEDGTLKKTYWESIFGSMKTFENSQNNLLVLAKQLKESGNKLPRLYEWCGTEDFLYNSQKDIILEMQNIGYDISYHESSGNHGWVYWDTQIQPILNWFLSYRAA